MPLLKSTTHTHTHPFNVPLSGTTLVSRKHKGKTNLDFTEARDSEWQWHQLGHMQVCTSLQTDNHASTPPLCFLRATCPSCRQTNSVKALKASLTATSAFESGLQQTQQVRVEFSTYADNVALPAAALSTGRATIHQHLLPTAPAHSSKPKQRRTDITQTVLCMPCGQRCGQCR